MSKVLIVVDMQNDFITGSLGTKEAVSIVPAVKKLIEDKKKEGYVIYATIDSHDSNYMNTLEGKKLPVEHCIIGTWGWEIEDSIYKALGDAVIINKPTFGSQELQIQLDGLDAVNAITDIEVCGLCTDICVVSNTLMTRANFKDIPITVRANCCAGVTPESHEAALKTMAMCQVDII